MKRVQLRAGYNPLILLQILFLSVSFSSFAQTKQSFKNHEEIDIGNGTKVEILKCTGDGPTEECDCIYFTDKRQNGTRMKVAAERIKEEERAANLAKNLAASPVKKVKPVASASNDNRADKTIPSSIVPKPKGAKQPITLEEAVMQADSVAAVSSKRINDQMAKEVMPEEDSTDAANTAASAKPAVPALNKAVEKTSSSSATLAVTKEKVKEVTAPDAPAKTMKPEATSKDTAVTSSSVPGTAASTPKNVLTVTKDTSANVGSTAVAGDKAIVSTQVEMPVKRLSADNAVKEAEAEEEQTYKKQYGNVKKQAAQPEQPVVKILPKEVPPGTQQAKAPDNIIKPSGKVDNVVMPVTKPASSSVADVVPFAENKSSLIAGSTQTVTQTPSKEVSDDAVKPTADDEKMNVIGRSAEVNVKGVWVNATIIDKETEFLYKVHYHGKSNEDDEWVAVSQIRNIDATVYKSAPKKTPANKIADKTIENKAAEVKAAQMKESEKKLAESKALEMKAAEAKAEEIKAAQIKESEKKLAQSKALEMKAAEAKAEEIKAAQIKESEKKLAESKALEMKAAEEINAAQIKESEKKLAESKALEMKAAEAKAEEIKAAQIKESEKKLAESKALEMKAAEAKAEEIKAAQIKESEKKLAESKALEMKAAEEINAAQIKESEKKLAESKALEMKAAEAKAEEIKAAQIKESEKKLAETKALEMKAAEAKAEEEKAAQMKELEKKLAETKALETKAAEAKAEEIKAAQIKESEKKLAETKALEMKAAETKLAENKAAEDKLMAGKENEMKAAENKSNPVSKPAAYVNCSFEPPASVVYNSQPFTEKVAKRKIYDNYMAAAKANNSVKTGVTFLSFKVEEPYVNAVKVAGSDSLEVRLAIAPAGTLIYLIRTEYKVCEQVLGRTSSKTMDKTYACFRSKEGAWTCEMNGQ